MRRMTISSSLRQTQGQSMIETALLLPILLILAFNAINFGYFFFVAVNAAAAPRSSVQYSIIGSSTPMQTTLAPAGPASSNISVSYVAYQDITGVLSAASTARVQVCTQANGVNASFQALCCQTAGSGGACSSTGTVAPHDPEYNAATNTSPFILNQVDIHYDIAPIIPPFRLGPIPLTLIPTLTIHRKVLMRVM